MKHIDKDSLVFFVLLMIVFSALIMEVKGQKTGRYSLVMAPGGIVIMDTKTAEIETCVQDKERKQRLLCSRMKKVRQKSPSFGWE